MDGLTRPAPFLAAMASCLETSNGPTTAAKGGESFNCGMGRGGKKPRRFHGSGGLSRCLPLPFSIEEICEGINCCLCLFGGVNLSDCRR